MRGQSFKKCFCERFRCDEADYERKAFRRCLYLHAWLLAPLVNLFSPSLFEPDRKLIHYLGLTTGRREALEEVMSYRDADMAQRHFARGLLRLRISGRKAADLADLILEED